jgi:16S rRNA (guanine(966)-N(2))-methyltransferase RsmD
VRAALFSSLGEAVEGSKFLDLFCGSGAVGIEAYSRGAARVTFVDVEVATLKENLALLPKEAYSVVNGDLFKAKLTGKYDIIFIDPPYGQYNIAVVLQFIKDKDLLTENGVIAYEESSKLKIDGELPYNLIKTRKYGDTVLMYLG